jgi:hypothetical protein
VRALSIVSCALACVLGCAVSAAAQDPQRTTVAASYSYLNDRDIEENFPAGWLVAVTHRISPGFGLVGEMGGNYKMDIEGTGIDLKVHAFMGGVRFEGAGRSVTPFAQVLAGVAQGSVSVPGTDDSISDNNFSVQPGAGVDLYFSERVGLRLQGDYRWIRGDDDNTSQFRFAAGLVIGIGG